MPRAAGTGRAAVRAATRRGRRHGPTRIARAGHRADGRRCAGEGGTTTGARGDARPRPDQRRRRRRRRPPSRRRRAAPARPAARATTGVARGGVVGEGPARRARARDFLSGAAAATTGCGAAPARRDRAASTAATAPPRRAGRASRRRRTGRSCDAASAAAAGAGPRGARRGRDAATGANRGAAVQGRATARRAPRSSARRRRRAPGPAVDGPLTPRPSAVRRGPQGSLDPAAVRARSAASTRPSTRSTSRRSLGRPARPRSAAFAAAPDRAASVGSSSSRVAEVAAVAPRLELGQRRLERRRAAAARPRASGPASRSARARSASSSQASAASRPPSSAARRSCGRSAALAARRRLARRSRAARAPRVQRPSATSSPRAVADPHDERLVERPTSRRRGSAAATRCSVQHAVQHGELRRPTARRRRRPSSHARGRLVAERRRVDRPSRASSGPAAGSGSGVDRRGRRRRRERAAARGAPSVREDEHVAGVLAARGRAGRSARRSGPSAHGNSNWTKRKRRWHAAARRRLLALVRAARRARA